MRAQVRFEGLTADELLALEEAEIDVLVLSGRPIVFAVGSAQILGSFAIENRALHIELAQIDGGGEGVLLAIRHFADALRGSALSWPSTGQCALLPVPTRT